MAASIAGVFWQAARPHPRMSLAGFREARGYVPNATLNIWSRQRLGCILNLGHSFDAIRAISSEDSLLRRYAPLNQILRASELALRDVVHHHNASSAVRFWPFSSRRRSRGTDPFDRLGVLGLAVANGPE